LGYRSQPVTIGNQVINPRIRWLALTIVLLEQLYLRAGNTFVEIFQYLNPVGKDSIPNRPACDAGITHICFDVINVDEEYERLLDAGITFHTPPVDVGGVVRTTYGRDPDGNIFELQEIIAPDLPQDLSTVIPDMKDLKIK